MNLFCLIIAGSDPSSGAGLQADIRTFDRCGIHAFSVVTAITYQTATEFYGYSAVSELKRQLDSILSAYPVDFVKIGMIPDKKSLEIIVNYIKKYNLKAILDPITVSSAGRRLADKNLEFQIEKQLFPHIIVLTPNIFEAEIYSRKQLKNINIDNIEDLKDAATIILKKMYLPNDLTDPENIEKAVIIKSGGEDSKKIIDLFLLNKKIGSQFKLEFKVFEKEKVPLTGNIHGTGCVFSSSIAAFLVKKNSIESAVELAEEFFNEKFQNFIELPHQGKIIDLTVSEEKLEIINQIKKVYNLISNSKNFSELIPEVRTNISASLPNAKHKNQIAGIEGRITIINGFPKACGEIKFGVSDHTARLILAAKKFDNSINFVMNLKYTPKLIKLIREKTDLQLQEIFREKQPEEVKNEEFSTMQWLIKESIKSGKIPDIIWDKGAIGKEPMVRLFGKNSEDMILKLTKIIDLLN
ncbi:MAG: bifunctional hydroxymethylpyrimidine kinase/phosphomethylpyrimidine kinase [Promethearchaeota archaeon]